MLLETHLIWVMLIETHLILDWEVRRRSPLTWHTLIDHWPACMGLKVFWRKWGFLDWIYRLMIRSTSSWSITTPLFLRFTTIYDKYVMIYMIVWYMWVNGIYIYITYSTYRKYLNVFSWMRFCQVYPLLLIGLWLLLMFSCSPSLQYSSSRVGPPDFLSNFLPITDLKAKK